jgi:hypothetical protein
LELTPRRLNTFVRKALFEDCPRPSA